MVSALPVPHKSAVSTRPLIVCDVDEVAFAFLTPFSNFLRSENLDLLPRSFRLHGNIVSRDDGAIVKDKAVSILLERFFAAQDQWQTPAEAAVETLNGLYAHADIVFLTAMPPRHEALRRSVLDRSGLPFPMVATECDKGPVVKSLRNDATRPVVFLDDIESNLVSVADNVPDCLLIHLMANAEFRAMAPQPRDGVISADDWRHADSIIRTHFSL